MAETTRPPLAEPRTAEPRTLNPFGTGQQVAAPRANGLISVEQQRAIAEVQARMIIARASPRDPIRAMEMILNDCTRVSLAEKATYAFARGGSEITGPTIRLAEAMAQRWGNIASGIKELSRGDGASECAAYAWDLETGFYDERQFHVKHWRDLSDEKSGGRGGYVLKSERDIYELIANFGQRRKRAVLLAVIPGDVTEAAVAECERTLNASADVSPEGVKRLADAFAEFGVTQPQIEARIQRRLEAIRPAQVVQLRKVYNSLRDGMSDAGDWFDVIESPSDPPPGPSEDKSADPPPAAARGRGRPRREAAPSTSETATAETATAETATAETTKSDEPAVANPPRSRTINFEV